MNTQIFYFLYDFANQSAINDKIIVFFAQTFPWFVIFTAGVFLVMHHELHKAEEPFKVFMQKKKEIFIVFLAGILAWILALVGKIVFHTDRPYTLLPDVHPLLVESSYAFPSQHTAFFVALAFGIFVCHKRAGYMFIFFALLIGIARIVAGVHFPVDILGGIVFGGLVGFIVSSISKQ